MKQTLLSINNYHYRRGGAEVVFLEQNRLLEEFGWRVVPFCMKHPKNDPSDWAQFFVDEIEFGHEYSLPQKLGRVAKVIYSFEARHKIRDLVRQVRPDVAHGHNVYHHISPSIFGALKSEGVPTVLTLHDLKLACPAYKMLADDGVCERCRGGHIWNVVRHRCIKGSLALSGVVLAETAIHRLLGCYSRHVDRFVVPSRFYVDKLVEWGWDRDRFAHVPNFVDVQAYVPDAKVGRKFVFFGRLGPEKGLATLVRAGAEARVPLMLIGTGPEEAALRKLAQETGSEVEFRGYLTGAPLEQAIREARAVVLPSEWYENAPMSVLEAYAIGRPVIGADIGGIPELIRDGETGAIFPSGDVTRLAECLRMYAEASDSDVAELGAQGRVWVEKEFTAERYRDRLLAVYHGLGVSQ